MKMVDLSSIIYKEEIINNIMNESNNSESVSIDKGEGNNSKDDILNEDVGFSPDNSP